MSGGPAMCAGSSGGWHILGAPGTLHHEPLGVSDDHNSSDEGNRSV